MTTILDKIVATKQREVAAAKQARSLAELQEATSHAPPPRDFFAALAASEEIALIAEVKKASPSKGIIRADFDPVAIAKVYAAHGASCLSVLTDESYFQGSLDYLKAIRAAVELPLLRKDFILDEYQVWEARAAGADAVLLIAECLDNCLLRKLLQQIHDLQMTALVEFYDPENLPRVLDAGATLIGVNNRDLRSFAVDLEHTLRMQQQIPADCLVVGESGIETRADVLRLQQAGVGAMLVGESLMRSPDIGRAVRELLGKS